MFIISNNSDNSYKRQHKQLLRAPNIGACKEDYQQYQQLGINNKKQFLAAEQCWRSGSVV
jgi:hypothetical protein